MFFGHIFRCSSSVERFVHQTSAPYVIRETSSTDHDSLFQKSYRCHMLAESIGIAVGS